jgi:hypothetical protein
MEKKKIIELEILEDDTHTGIEKISLVESPAITINFLALNEAKPKEFVKPTSSETEGDFIGRCMSVLVGDEGKPQDQAYAICKSTWDSSKNLEKKEITYEFLNDESTVETIIALASELGYSDEDVIIDSEKFASVTSIVNNIREEAEFEPTTRIRNGENFYLYKYTGPITDNSRPFCRAMRRLNRYYSYDELQAMSGLALNPGFGPSGTNTYSIFDWKGGVYCKHYWSLYRVYRDGSSIRGSLIGPAAPIAGIATDDTPSRGRLNFSKHIFASEDQRMIISPVIIPDLEIIRYDEASNDPYWVKFSTETIAKMAEKFMRSQSTWSTNLEHEDNQAGTYIFESWIIEDEKTDKANMKYGFNLPNGTWMVKMRVADDKVWSMVKEGKLKGLSLEGNFLDGAELEEIQRGNILERINRIIKK